MFNADRCLETCFILWVFKEDLVSRVIPRCKPDWCCTRGFSRFSLGYQAFKNFAKGFFFLPVVGGECTLCFLPFACENSRQCSWFLSDFYVLVHLLQSEWRESYIVGKRGVNRSLCNSMLSLHLNSSSTATERGLVTNTLYNWLVIGFYSSNHLDWWVSLVGPQSVRFCQNS